MFNDALKESVDTLATALPEAKLTYLNTVGISSSGPAGTPNNSLQMLHIKWFNIGTNSNIFVMSLSISARFSHQVMTPVANISTQSQITCKSGDSAIRPDRSKALLFDNIHTTKAVNQATAARYYTAKDPSDASPYDIQKLASL